MAFCGFGYDSAAGAEILTSRRDLNHNTPLGGGESAQSSHHMNIYIAIEGGLNDCSALNVLTLKAYKKMRLPIKDLKPNTTPLIRLSNASVPVVKSIELLWNLEMRR